MTKEELIHSTEEARAIINNKYIEWLETIAEKEYERILQSCKAQASKGISMVSFNVKKSIVAQVIKKLADNSLTICHMFIAGDLDTDRLHISW